ncbi:Sodium/solute symporter superfamily [Sesbania bispinosa]|nr:Sodium/solute symporter superfamily [Sesbania bispinosa]
MNSTKSSVVSVFNDTSGGFEVCIKNDRNMVGSLGVWVGDNPFDFVVPVTLCQIIICSLFSRGIYYALRPFKTPKFICNVIGGVLLGPTFLGRNRQLMEVLFPLKQSAILIILAKVGATYFVFINALKMDVITPHLEGITGPAYSIPNVFTVSSFAVVSEALTELNLITTELGQIALSSAMISEIMQWATITLQFNSEGDFIYSVGFMACTSLFIVLLFVLIQPAMKSIARRTPVGKPVNEMYIVMILLGVLIMATIGDTIGLNFIVGPTLFGLVMPNGPPLATTIIERSELIISELLMPFFYINVGITTNSLGIHNHWKGSVIFLGILFLGFLAKIISCVLIAPSCNIRLKHGVVLGLILNIKGIVELIYFSRIKKAVLIDEEIYSQMVLYVVVITSVCIPLIRNMYKHRSRVLTTPSIHERRVRTIQSSPENTEFNIISCLHNDANVHSMIAMLEICNPTIESPICVHVIHFIELLGKSTPILLPMNIQNKKSPLSINYPNTNHILRAFENYSKNSQGPVTIFPYVNVAPYNSMHEAICNLAEDKSVHFLIIPFHENDQSFGSDIGTSIRNLNSSFQATASCTVGILVDRYSELSMSTSKLCFHVGIFFLGGPDDREALALIIRMMDRTNMKVTLFKFVMNNNNSSVAIDKILKGNEEEEENFETTLDESLIDEFKAKKINKDDVIFHEILVDDCIQVLEAIRGLESNDYDLVMVGKRHNMGDLTDEEMSNFMDNAKQLGIFGDMLASTEFCNGRASVLVMQCGEKRVNYFE